MTRIIELHTGHVFAEGSVKAVGPVACAYIPHGDFNVRVHGVGFTVDIHDTVQLPEPPQCLGANEHAQWVKAQDEWRTACLALMEARRQLIIKALLA